MRLLFRDMTQETGAVLKNTVGYSLMGDSAHKKKLRVPPEAFLLRYVTEDGDLEIRTIGYTYPTLKQYVQYLRDRKTDPTKNKTRSEALFGAVRTLKRLRILMRRRYGRSSLDMLIHFCGDGASVNNKLGKLLRKRAPWITCALDVVHDLERCLEQGLTCPAVVALHKGFMDTLRGLVNFINNSNVHFEALQAEDDGVVLGAVIDWRWAASTLRCLGQFFLAFKGVASVLKEDPKAKPLLDKMLTLDFIALGGSSEELSSVEYKGQRTGFTFADLTEISAAITRMDGDPATRRYTKEMTESVTQVRGGPPFVGLAVKGTSTKALAAGRTLRQAIVREARRRLVRYDLIKHLKWLNPSTWPTPNHPSWDTVGNSAIEHLVGHWNEFLMKRHRWTDPLFGVLEEWQDIKRHLVEHKALGQAGVKDIVSFWKPAG